MGQVTIANNNNKPGTGVVANGCDGHQGPPVFIIITIILILSPPEAFRKAPSILMWNHQSLVPPHDLHSVTQLRLAQVDKGGKTEDHHACNVSTNTNTVGKANTNTNTVGKANTNYDEEQAELFVGLFEGVEKCLKSSKVTKQLVDSQDSHYLHTTNGYTSIPAPTQAPSILSDHLHEADDLANLPYVIIVPQSKEHHGDVEGKQREEVDEVHWLQEELEFDRATDEPGYGDTCIVIRLLPHLTTYSAVKKTTVKLSIISMILTNSSSV